MIYYALLSIFFPKLCRYMRAFIHVLIRKVYSAVL